MKILLVEDDALSRRMMAKVLEDFLGHDITECDSAEEAWEQYGKDSFPLVITDIRMPGSSGLDLLRSIKETEAGNSTDVLLITGFANLETALSALREGASDLLRKPIQVKELITVVSRIIKQRSILADTAAQKLKNLSFKHEGEAESTQVDSVLLLPDGSRIGLFSREIRANTEIALRYHEDRSISVLIEGETGTGKELIGKLIHYGLEDEKRPFVIFNCAAISPNLFESELFGYVGGAFTGARSGGARGKFEAANGGTIFLDEVSEIPITLQTKLLRVLEEKAIYRVGSSVETSVDVRVLAATNQNLEDMVQRGDFRKDLFFRLNVGRISLSPLHHQRMAIVPLAQMFLTENATRKNRHFQFVHKSAAKILEKHDWPGNVRQLRNLIEHVVLLFDDTELKPEHLTHLSTGFHAYTEEREIIHTDSFVLPPKEFDYETFTVNLVRKALDMHHGNKSETARYLGLSLSKLRTLLKKL